MKAIPAQAVWEDAPVQIQTAADAFQRLKDLYTSTLAYEFAHVLEKPYSNIFAEFLHATTKNDPPADNIKVVITEGWTGDVKYHLGRNRVVEDSEAHVTRVTLANNPSHLEFVDPVIEGYTQEWKAWM
ncbi:hypothetical protein [Ectobacillus panaciterrae]|uniref:hypothetical protein n=1 Tax=Ectobacillus panaciterrae TaxID=363872 RepID=UPI000423EEC5|nr:hypothetical protein [Ectobacillus panaciterrae]